MSEKNKVDKGLIIGLTGVLLVLFFSIGLMLVSGTAGDIFSDYVLLGGASQYLTMSAQYAMLGLVLLVSSIISLLLIILSFTNTIKTNIEGIILFIIGFLCIGVSIFSIIISNSIMMARVDYVFVMGILIGIMPIIGGFLRMKILNSTPIEEPELGLSDGEIVKRYPKSKAARKIRLKDMSLWEKIKNDNIYKTIFIIAIGSILAISVYIVSEESSYGPISVSDIETNAWNFGNKYYYEVELIVHNLRSTGYFVEVDFYDINNNKVHTITKSIYHKDDGSYGYHKDKVYGSDLRFESTTFYDISRVDIRILDENRNVVYNTTSTSWDMGKIKN